MQTAFNKPLLPTVLFVFILNSFIFSQNSNWKEIIIITKNNDTIHGSISYKTRFKSYNMLLVKNKGETGSKFYHPKDVKSFIIKTDEETLFFQTLIVDADYSPTDFEKLQDSPEVELTHDTVFTQLLLQGPRSVFYYMDDIVYKEHYLIETADGQVTDLINKAYLVKDLKNSMAYTAGYKKQLAFLLASPSIPAERILAMPFKRKYIVPLVKDYNATVSSGPSTYEYKNEKAKFKFGLIAGSNLTSLKFNAGARILNQLNFNLSTGLNAGATMNIILPGTGKKWSIYSGFMYSSYKMESKGLYIYYENSDWYKLLTNASINVSCLKLYTAMRYQSSGCFSPFIQLGIANGYAFRYSTKANYETRFYSSFTTETTPLIKFRKYEQSLFVGVGAGYKKVGLELRYEHGNGFSRASGISSNMNYGYVLVSYTF